MADKYVDKTGSDSNTGGSGDPYLTVNKGLDNVGDGDTVFIAIGTYDEQHVFDESSQGGKDIALQGSSKDDVTLTYTAGTRAIYLSNTTFGTLRLSGLTISMGSSGDSSIMNNGVADVFIDDCILSSPAACVRYLAGVSHETMDLYVNNSTLISESQFIEIDEARDVVVTGCAAEELTALNATGALVRFDDNDCRNIIISGNTVTAEQGGLVSLGSGAAQDSLTALYVTGNTVNGNAVFLVDLKYLSSNTVITGNTLTKSHTSASSIGISIGVETTGAFASPTNDINPLPLTGSVVIENNSITYEDSANQDHGILVGLTGDIDVIISGNFVKSEDFGIVVKEATGQVNNCTIVNNRVWGKDCIYPAGNNNTSISNNSVYVTEGFGIKIDENQRLEGISEDTKIYANIIHNVGTGQCIQIAGTDDENTFSDNNCLISTGSGYVGKMAGGTQTALSDVLTLWQNATGWGGGAASHEKNEGISIELNPFFTDPSSGDFTVNNSSIPSYIGSTSLTTTESNRADYNSITGGGYKYTS